MSDLTDIYVRRVIRFNLRRYFLKKITETVTYTLKISYWMLGKISPDRTLILLRFYFLFYFDEVIVSIVFNVLGIHCYINNRDISY